MDNLFDDSIFPPPSSLLQPGSCVKYEVTVAIILVALAVPLRVRSWPIALARPVVNRRNLSSRRVVAMVSQGWRRGFDIFPSTEAAVKGENTSEDPKVDTDFVAVTRRGMLM